MATIRISVAEAARDFANLIDRVREGEEIVIESESSPVALLRPPFERSGRLPSEIIALTEAHSKALGFEPVMDNDFAADLEDIIRERKPADRSAWD